MLDFGPIGSRFRDVALLGGSAPVLYRAVHAGLGCPVLIKAMPRLSAGTSAPAALFVRGARAAARIDHPNVVRVLDLVAAPAADLLVQEWVGGPTLDDVLRRPEPMPIDRAFAAAAELADALAAAHARGLVHRSLSPAAVQFTPGGSAKLGGFEAAVVPDDPADPWPAQARLGNVLYTAPEQDRDGTASPRSDVYSLGALLYQMLTGRPPFAGSSPAAVQYQKAGSDPPPPARLRPDLPPAADQVVRRMMARNPGARFRDMADARDALRRFAAPTPEAEPGRRPEILLNYPSPIAWEYARVWRDPDWAARVGRLFDLAEGAVKYCAAAAVLAACDARGQAPPPRLDRLPRPSFGVWLGYLRAALELPRGASPFVDRLREAAYAPRPGGGNWLDLAGEVVAARNDARHGRAAPDDGRHFGELLARVHDLLRDLAWLPEFPLVRVERITYLKKLRRFEVQYRLCAGVAPVAGEEHRAVFDEPLTDGQVGLLAPGGGFLDLTPFARYARCPVCDQEDVFLYNQMPADGRVLLMSGHGPHPFEDASAEAFAERGLVWTP